MHSELTLSSTICRLQDAIVTEYSEMMGHLNALFAQQKALLSAISQPLPPPPGADGDTNVVRFERTFVCHALLAPAMARLRFELAARM